MKITLLCGVFPPEPVVSAQTLSSIARELTNRGHQVVVIAPIPSRPGGKIYPGYKNKLFSKEKSQVGYALVRSFSWPSSKSSFISRFKENFVFGLSAALYMLFMPKADVIYALTWPIFATGLMSLVARFRGIPYILRVADLYPESIVIQKRLGPNAWPVKLMRAIDKWIASGAKHVSVLTSYFAQVYINDRKIAPEKVSTIPDWAIGDLDDVGIDAVKSIRDQFDITNDDFVAAYGGNIGIAAGVDTLVKASALIDHVRVLIAGDGSELSACRDLANKIAPRQVSFYSPWPKEKTMPLYHTADVLVLPTYGEQSIASIPSKLIRYMLSSRAIIAAGLPGTELWKVMEESGCGWIIPPDDPQALAEAIVEARKAGAAERARRGICGRDYAQQNLTEGNNLPKIIRIIESVLD